jgi:hypothetical protein
MKEWQGRAQVNWDCKYRVVILPKSRRKAWYARMRQAIGQILWDLCRQMDIGLVGAEGVAARPGPRWAELRSTRRPLQGAFPIPPALPVGFDFG